MVIAPGSVMNEPRRGATIRMLIHHAAGELPPRRAMRCSVPSASSTIGRVDASAMITITNKGSV